MKQEGSLNLILTICAVNLFYTKGISSIPGVTRDLTKMANEQVFARVSEEPYPVFLIPKRCTALEGSFEVNDKIFLDLKVTTLDTEGKITCLYAGYCNVKVIDSLNYYTDSNSSNSIENTENTTTKSNEGDQNQSSYNQSQVWIDPARSPYVYNNYDGTETQEQHSVYKESHSSHIMIQQHNTNITQNIFHCIETKQYSVPEEFEHKKFRKTQSVDTCHHSSYESDELQCGVYLSQLSEDIITAEENKAREELRYLDVQSKDSALKQLMSEDIQSSSKQQRTILFLGHDSQLGHTIQNIAVNDPSLECIENYNAEDVTGMTSNSREKKYRCDKCKQIFNQLATFKKHMVGSLKSPVLNDEDMKFNCTHCKKNFKTQHKFEQHCLGHGNPQLECDKCYKVFATKFSLRKHNTQHAKKHSCYYCKKTYSSEVSLQNHINRLHKEFICNVCEYATEDYYRFKEHLKEHERNSETDGLQLEEIECESVRNDDMVVIDEEEVKKRDIAEANSVIEKVVSNKLFMLRTNGSRRNASNEKICNVCDKKFYRLSDLKRHLIEHIMKSTLSKSPVNTNGTLAITCEVCQTETFSKVEKYKAHLREHAKLTIYKCTFCDKSFSDSSNFSKHKKIHVAKFFQCDYCQRKFHSKRMIAQHMEYHNNNMPIVCFLCNKEFYFESSLNKHIKTQHSKDSSRYRCRFCQDYYGSLKGKWDHEWIIHKVRKVIVDCLLCGAKFRKYSELKRHCYDTHSMEIPPAKMLKNEASSYIVDS